MKHKLFKPFDLIVAAAVLLCAAILAVFFLPHGQAKTAVVRYRGAVLDTVELSSLEKEEIRSYELAEGVVTVRFDADGVSVIASPCCGQNCVHTGKLDKDGAAILCAPLALSITLSGDAEVDGMTG